MPEQFITLDTRQLKKIDLAIKRLMKKGAKVDGPLKRFGVYHLSKTVLGFRRGGRDKKWKKLSKVTIKIRKWRGITGTKPLVARGWGKRSIDTALLKWKGNRAIATFTKLGYMKIHQTGGTAVVTGRYGAKRSIKVPQRKYLLYTSKDTKKAMELLIAHEKKVIASVGMKRAA